MSTAAFFLRVGEDSWLSCLAEWELSCFIMHWRHSCKLVRVRVRNTIRVRVRVRRPGS